MIKKILIVFVLVLISNVASAQIAFPMYFFDVSFPESFENENIMKNILKNKDKPYDELEPLLNEASNLMYNNYYVEVIWGDLLLKEKRYAEASEHYKIAVDNIPDEIENKNNLYMKLGFSALYSMQYNIAAENFDKITYSEPDNFHSNAGAGMAYFHTQSSYEEAEERLEKAIELTEKQDEKNFLEKLLAQTKEYLASTENTTKNETQRFVIRFGGDSQEDLDYITYDILDDIYYQVTNFLNFYPDERIIVFFYPTDQYYKANKEWSAGSAQGIQINVPLKYGYKSPEYVKGLLAHEFTHTIIHLKTKNNCPSWLNEGLAQYEEFTASYGSPDKVRGDFESIIRDEFLGGKNYLSLAKATATYSSSKDHGGVSRSYVAFYMATKCMAEYYGETAFDEILTKLGEGKTIDEALTDSIGKDQKEFEEEYSEWLKSQ